ncbi:hypothetical protein NQD34_013515 [Periophthalmus magnuspinnatus]|nr:hypothetical protein NQD34_013515 [Periophthalmus magnuspinnatus]
MSGGETLRAAVEQRLMGVLQEVLELIQSTVDQYESQLKQCREEESKRLRGERLLLLRTETTGQSREAEKEQNEMFIETNIKVEEPDLWSISETQPQLRAPASGLNKDPPPPTTTQRHPHEQDHENLTPNHKTKSEDSDEECPICRQLDLHQKEELTEQALTTETTVTNTRCNNENTQTSNQEERIKPGEFENMEEKSNEDVQGYSDSTKKLLQNVCEQERQEEENAQKRTVTDQEMEPNCRQTCKEMQEETLVSSGLKNHLGNGIDNSTLVEIEKEGPNENAGKFDTQNSNYAEGGLSINEEDLKSRNNVDSKSNGSSDDTQISIDQERKKEGEHSQKGLKRTVTDVDQEMVPKCKKISSETQDETIESAKVVSTSLDNYFGDAIDNAMSDPKEQETLSKKKSILNVQYSNSMDKGQSINEQNQDSTSLDPETQQNKLSDAENTNVQDEVLWLTQNMVKKLPTVRLVPLKITNISAQNGVQMMKSSIRKPALSPQSILKENLEKQKLCETLRSDESQQNSVQNLQKSTNTRMFTKSLSGPARSSELVKSPSMRSSPKKVSQKDQEKNSDMLLEKQQSSRAQNNIRKAKQNHGKVDLESSSDKNNYNYKIPSDSGKSKEDRNSKIKTVQSGPVTDQQGTRSLKLRSKIVIDSPHKTSQNSNDRKVSETREMISSTSKKSKTPKSTDKHECLECGTTFALKGNLLKHLVIHQEKRPFSCSKCEATFKRKLNLKAHMSTHLEEKEFECPVCKKRYTRKLNLDDHMKAHSGHKPYTCLVCARTFSCGSNLRRHMVSHTGLRPFECEVCGKKYGRKSILTEHMASHSREQPFSCSICKNKFSLKNTLRKHMRIHDKERKYKCSECEATFSQKVHLNQHMFKHTGDKPFKCSVCQKGFTRKAYVQQHKKLYCFGPRNQRLAHKQAQSPAHGPDHKQIQSPAHSPAHKQDRAVDTQEGQTGE